MRNSIYLVRAEPESPLVRAQEDLEHFVIILEMIWPKLCYVVVFLLLVSSSVKITEQSQLKLILCNYKSSCIVEKNVTNTVATVAPVLNAHPLS